MDKQLNEWLFYAESDLKSAEILLKTQNSLFHISIYHSHQCAEKIIKTFMLYHKIDHIPRIHNLSKLLLDISIIEPDIIVIGQSPADVIPA